MSAAAEGTWDWSRARSLCLREARRVLAEPADAEEAAQEALVRAWRRRHSCQTPDAPLAWMAQIARNEALRTLAHRRRLRAREAPEHAGDEPGGHDPELDRVIGALATDQALAGLRPDERRLLHLRYVHDLSHPELAQLLKVPEGTVKVKLHRLRGRVRAVFEAG